MTLFDGLDDLDGPGAVARDLDEPPRRDVVGRGTDGTVRVEVRRSTRRTRTVSARREGDTIVVMVPARMSKAQERRTVAEMVERVRSREKQLLTGGARAGDAELQIRAAELSQRYLDGRAKPVSVRWVDNMEHRWGSCTSVERTIRLSRRLAAMPDWVVDYVLVHELAHLLEDGHDAAFWAWVARYPRTERARGYLEGVAMAAHLPMSDGSPD